MDVRELAAMLDQTLLKPMTGFAEGRAWIAENAELGFASLCVSPFLVPEATELLAATSTSVCSVVSFPLGYATSESKSDEAAVLVGLGCTEVDMVINVAALLEGEDEYVRRDIEGVTRVVELLSEGRGLVKVILETGLLGPDDIRRGCELSVRAGAKFVKTSTGFGPRGASVADVELMRATVGPGIGVKAAGGVRTLEAALDLIDAGASRIGTSAGSALLEAAAERGR